MIFFLWWRELYRYLRSLLLCGDTLLIQYEVRLHFLCRRPICSCRCLHDLRIHYDLSERTDNADGML